MREREKERGREGGRERETETETVSVCVLRGEHPFGREKARQAQSRDSPHAVDPRGELNASSGQPLTLWVIYNSF